MEKVKVRLNQKLDKAGKCFYDIAGKQKVKPSEFGKNKEFVVSRTDFVNSKIASGELLLIGVVE